MLAVQEALQQQDHFTQSTPRDLDAKHLGEDLSSSSARPRPRPSSLWSSLPRLSPVLLVVELKAEHNKEVKREKAREGEDTLMTKHPGFDPVFMKV